MLTNGGFTDGARVVLDRSRAVAVRLNHSNIGPEHLLLALTNPVSPIIAYVLQNQNTTAVNIREKLEERITYGNIASIGQIGIESEIRNILEFAVAEAETLNALRVAPEHLFLGILVEERSLAANVLQEFGFDIDTVRKDMENYLGLHELEILDTSRDPKTLVGLLSLSTRDATVQFGPRLWEILFSLIESEILPSLGNVLSFEEIPCQVTYASALAKRYGCSRKCLEYVESVNDKYTKALVLVEIAQDWNDCELCFRAARLSITIDEPVKKLRALCAVLNLVSELCMIKSECIL